MLDKIRNYYSKERWEHIKGMLSLLNILGEKNYSFTERFFNKLTYAILLHDSGKLFEDQFSKKYYFPIYHAYLSRSIAIHAFGIEDKDMLNAILFHPTGREKMSILEIFLYLIDFSELNRTFTEAKICRNLIYNNKLYEALIYAAQVKLYYIEKKKQPLNLNTIKMVKYYEKMA
ncbi:HD domain-containing protein [bacterium]|nr:HD domain-containing protein [bacterium]